MTIPLAKITKTILVIVVLGAMMLSSACILVDVEDDTPSPEITELPTNTHYVTPSYEPTTESTSTPTENPTIEPTPDNTSTPTVTPAVESAPEIIDPTSPPTPEKITVVLNTSTMVFHAGKNCHNAAKIDEENKKIVEIDDIQEVKDMGYKACGTCSKAYRD